MSAAGPGTTASARRTGATSFRQHPRRGTSNRRRRTAICRGRHTKRSDWPGRGGSGSSPAYGIAIGTIAIGIIATGTTGTGTTGTIAVGATEPLGGIARRAASDSAAPVYWATPELRFNLNARSVPSEALCCLHDGSASRSRRLPSRERPDRCMADAKTEMAAP